MSWVIVLVVLLQRMFGLNLKKTSIDCGVMMIAIDTSVEVTDVVAVVIISLICFFYNLYSTK